MTAGSPYARMRAHGSLSGMAAACCATRVVRDAWESFIGPLTDRAAISISAADVWSR